MRVNRKQFVSCLERVIPAIGMNVLVPEFQYVQIGEGKIQAYDGTMLIDMALPEKPELRCAVPGGPLLHLLKSLSDEEVEMVPEEGKFIVKTDRVKGVFTVLDTVKIRDFPLSDNAIAVPEIISDLVEGLGFCRFGVSKDETAGPLCGVRIDEGVILSSDRYRIVKWNLSERSTIPIKCSLPTKFVDVIVKSKSEVSDLDYIGGKRFSALLKDGSTITSPVLTGDYPDLLQYFPSFDEDHSEMGFSSEEDLNSVLDRQIGFLKNVDLIDKEVTIKVDKDKCVISSVNKEWGELAEEISVSPGGDSVIEFLINPVFLKDVVKLCSSFKFYSKKGLVLFETDKLQYLVKVRE